MVFHSPSECLNSVYAFLQPIPAWQEAGLEVVASTVSALELLLQDLVDVAHSKDSSPWCALHWKSSKD